MAADRAQMFPGKHFISTILDALDTKTAMSGFMRRRYLQRAAMAGILIGLMYVVNYTVISTFAALPAGTGNLAGVGRMVGALAFGWALVFIYYSKSELLTSNMMIVSIGVLRTLPASSSATSPRSMYMRHRHPPSRGMCRMLPAWLEMAHLSRMSGKSLFASTSMTPHAW